MLYTAVKNRRGDNKMTSDRVGHAKVVVSLAKPLTPNSMNLPREEGFRVPVTWSSASGEGATQKADQNPEGQTAR